MNGFVDIAAQVLPNMVHGRSAVLSADEAKERLCSYPRKNIKTLITAPLFDPRVQKDTEFLAQREEAIGLAEAVCTDMVRPLRILPGALLPFHESLLTLREPQRFALWHTRYLLLQLPDAPLSPAFYDLHNRIALATGLVPLIADIERYFDLFSLEDFLAMREAGIMTQISAGGFLNSANRKLALYLLANHSIHFVASGATLGSEIRLVEAMQAIKRALPLEHYKRIKSNPRMMLSNADPRSFLSAEPIG